MKFATLSETQREKIIKLFKANVKCSKIAIEVKISETTIRAFLISQNYIKPKINHKASYPVYKVLTDADMEDELKTIIFK